MTTGAFITDAMLIALFLIAIGVLLWALEMVVIGFVWIKSFFTRSRSTTLRARSAPAPSPGRAFNHRRGTK